jgi:3-oxoadipate enol-lactonase
MDFTLKHDLTTHYLREGNREGTPLVFINALGTDLRIWDAVVPHLVERHPVIRYDKRGHGLSDCPPAPYSIRDFSNDLLGLLDHLEVSQATLVGISVGGIIALDFAVLCPERVHALVLCDTAPKIGTADLWNERINTLRAQGMHSMADAILSRWFAPSFKEQSPASYRGHYNMLTRTPVEGYTGTCEAIRDADLTEAVKAISMRTLVLSGAEDVSTPPDVARKLVELIPDVKFQEIPGAGHLTCVEQPDAVAERIERFL